MTDVEVVDIGDHNLHAAKAFLEQNPETSLFLLSNIRAYGTRLGQSLYSGNLKGLQQGGKLCGIFSLTRGGSLLVQTAGRTEYALSIVQACAAEPFKIRGILGEWHISKSIWDLLAGQLSQTFVSKEVSYRRDLAGDLPAAASSPASVRLLTADDHAQWDELAVAFRRESGLPEQGTPEQHKVAFLRSTGMEHWGGAFCGQQLVSIAAVIAFYETIAQIGSVFTVPQYRGQGVGRAVMTSLIRDSRQIHRLDRLFLFTGEDNVAARRLYESLGFERFGHFGLFFGE